MGLEVSPPSKGVFPQSEVVQEAGALGTLFAPISNRGWYIYRYSARFYYYSVPVVRGVVYSRLGRKENSRVVHPEMCTERYMYRYRFVATGIKFQLKT